MALDPSWPVSGLQNGSCGSNGASGTGSAGEPPLWGAICPVGCRARCPLAPMSLDHARPFRAARIISITLVVSNHRAKLGFASFGRNSASTASQEHQKMELHILFLPISEDDRSTTPTETRGGCAEHTGSAPLRKIDRPTALSYNLRQPDCLSAPATLSPFRNNQGDRASWQHPNRCYHGRSKVWHPSQAASAKQGDDRFDTFSP